MPVSGVRLTRSWSAAGERVVRLGVPLLDDYLEFLAGRCRPNTVLAVAYDLKVFFTVMAKPPRRVRPLVSWLAGASRCLAIAGASWVIDGARMCSETECSVCDGWTVQD